MLNWIYLNYKLYQTVKTPGSQRSKEQRNVSPEPSTSAHVRSPSSDRNDENAATESSDLFGNDNGEELTVRDSSLGLIRDLETESNGSSKPASKMSLHSASAALNVIESAVDKFPSEMINHEALSVLKSIVTEVKAVKSNVQQQGEIMNAFIASEHEYRRKVTSELSEIKELFKIENARWVP